MSRGPDERAVAAVRGAVRRVLAARTPGATVLVACSGGADSLALAAAAVAEARDLAVRVVGVTVDHGLQEGSAERATRVVEQLAALGVDETMTARVGVVPDGRGPEAAAREARYAVLGQAAAHLGAEAVLLGHTRDDQAETVLMGLTRGSGGRSVAGMRPSYDDGGVLVARPLLEVARAQTEGACRALGLTWWDDPHNTDPRFLRSRVRGTLMPLLEAELGPGVAQTLARTGEQLRGDMELLDDLAETLRADAARGGPGEHTYAAGVLAAAPGPLRRRALHRAALAAGAPPAELAHVHVLGAEALVVDWHGQRWADLPGPLRVVRRDGMIHLAAPPPTPATDDDRRP
ncbi:tRNA lysidine(34) synthetase TilS [Nocardioides sp. CFH 31398]|uniref:tRNA lysidine(34) synthetase TilS n=1 Tax=Nocardioides sp. CFH 31398 TaxID=2919579 RepID=UPI001F05B67B|nr:tRNA lysidine(34) synthetase TilS [Nocardioides sp. CFH 31398]MCH1866147.1 tRNA lysidine(34) synthetase TilS [Nocardioides sp. CFH 31398]